MANYSAFADIAAPTTANSETIGVSLGTEFVCQPGWLMGYRFVRPTVATTGPFTAAFYSTATGTADPATVVSNINPSTVGWVEVLLPAPVYYSAQIRARATIHHPSGRYAFLNNAFAADGTWPAGRTNGPLFVPPSNATAQGQGLFKAGASIAMPDQMFDETFYYVDVIWSDTDPIVRTGTGSTSATAALTSAGAKAGTGTASLTAAAALAPAGTKTGVGAAALEAEAALAAAGGKAFSGSGAIAAAALLDSVGTAARQGAATLTAVATAAGVGTAGRRGAGAVTASAALHSSGRNPANELPDRQLAVGRAFTPWSVGAPTNG